MTHPLERVSSIEAHPKIFELEDQGITSRSLIDCVLFVYLQLVEVHHWFDVDTVVVSDKQLVFLKGRKTYEAKSFDYILPVGSDVKFTGESMNDYIVCAKSCGCICDSLTLAFVDNTSTILYYKITNGLVPPRVPSNKEMEKMQNLPYWNERKRKLKTLK